MGIWAQLCTFKCPMNKHGPISMPRKEHEPRSLEPLAYSVSEACEVLPFGRTKIYELIKSGVIRSKKVDGRRLIPRRELERLAGLDTEN